MKEESGGSTVLIGWTLLRLNLSAVNDARVRDASSAGIPPEKGRTTSPC